MPPFPSSRNSLGPRRGSSQRTLPGPHASHMPSYLSNASHASQLASPMPPMRYTCLPCHTPHHTSHYTSHSESGPGDYAARRTAFGRRILDQPLHLTTLGKMEAIGTALGDRHMEAHVGTAGTGRHRERRHTRLTRREMAYIDRAQGRIGTEASLTEHKGGLGQKLHWQSTREDWDS